MIRSENRFKGHRSLNFVYKKGKTVRSSAFAVKYIANPKRDTWRLAVVVSKKVDPLAVGRNRIRRRMFELLRTTIPEDFPSMDMVVTVYDKKVANEEHKKLQSQVADIITKISSV